MTGAYPRSRGGTIRNEFWRVPYNGLSPLTRGNREVSDVEDWTEGPIPAHAGEPEKYCKKTRSLGAYPRSRGGTTLASSLPHRPHGLSPLTRGNPRH